MKIATRTLKSGFTMPAVGKGTWMAGTKRKTYSRIDESLHIEKIKNALASGVTYIDSAERYADGHGEELLGKAIKGLEREKLFLTSKLSSKHRTYDSVILAAKRSINRMKALYLDVYFIHYYDSRVSLSETMRAMDYLIDTKKIKYIGVCNFTSEQLEEAQSYTKNKIVANQVRYNFMSQQVAKSGLMEFCLKHDIMLIAWRPFPQDLVTSEIKTILEPLAKKHAKTNAQIATAWLMQQKNVVVLASLANDDELQKTVEALTIVFDKKDNEDLIERRNTHDK